MPCGLGFSMAKTKEREHIAGMECWCLNQYELWEADNGDFLAQFDHEGDALAAVRDLLDAHPTGLVLRKMDKGKERRIAAGDALVRLALAREGAG